MLKIVYNRKVLFETAQNIWSVGQGVKTPPFHGGNTGSNPVRTILLKLGEPGFMLLRISSVGSSA